MTGCRAATGTAGAAARAAALLLPSRRTPRPRIDTGRKISAERFPAIGACVDWLANYALIDAFPAWHASIGLGWVMVCFAVLCVVAIGFVYKFLPETKRLSVEPAVQVYEREAEGSGLGRLAGRPPAALARRA